MSKGKNLALGAVLIAGAGYVAGLLTAPKSGKETRKDIRAAALKAKTEAERRLKLAHSELSKLLDQATILARSGKAKASEELQKAIAQAEIVRKKTRELLSAIHEGEAEDKDLQKAIDEVKKSIKHLKQYVDKKTPKTN
jgi:gas vesicle protein